MYLQVATTLLKEEAAAGLEENAPLQQVVKRLEQQRCVCVCVCVCASVCMCVFHLCMYHNKPRAHIITQEKHIHAYTHSTAETAAAARVDHLLVGLAESCKQMRGAVQGKFRAFKFNHSNHPSY